MAGCEGGGVNIGDASNERLGKSTPERCHSFLAVIRQQFI